MVLMRWSHFALIPLSVGFVACGGEAASQEGHHREDRTFTDANPDAPMDADERAELQQALRRLAKMADEADTELTRDLAWSTLERIEAGSVLLGSIGGAKGIDRWHMCKDYALDACAGDWPDDPEWIGDESVSALLTGELDGYQWGNRLYFSFRDDTDAVSVAATLVHEVNHVLNRSECSYYEDIDAHRVDDTLAYVEEYRAFFSECFYSDDANAELDACHAHALDHLEGYELSPNLSEVLPDGSEDPRMLGELLLETDDYGSIVPVEEAWPESFVACHCVGARRDDGGACRGVDGRFIEAACCE